MNKLASITILTATLTLTLSSCKKEGCPDENATNYNPEAEKSDGSCIYGPIYVVPDTYTFTDENGNSTVSYSGQTERLDQLAEMTTYLKSGNASILDVQVLLDMFANTGDNGNGNFSFSSTKQLEDKCFDLDINLYKSYMDSIVLASQSNGNTAANNQAGTLTSGTSTYLFSANGIEYAQLIEKGLMGAVFMNQALNVYFGNDKLNVDNTVAVDAAGGKYYTQMEHHIDEAFGYFGVPTNFPASLGQDRFWGKYCNARDEEISCNDLMMKNFIITRAAVEHEDYTSRDNAIAEIRKTWELISAAQAVHYFEGALSNLGTDQAKFLHELSEAYAFTQNLRYAPTETRRITPTEVSTILADYVDFWDVTPATINATITTLKSKYNL